MKLKSHILPTSAILAASTLVGCVPAQQTIAVIDAQNRVANRELATERQKTQGLYATRQNLESQLANLRSRKQSLVTSDPVKNQGEISRLGREIASMERHLRMQL